MYERYNLKRFEIKKPNIYINKKFLKKYTYMYVITI